MIDLKTDWKRLAEKNINLQNKTFITFGHLDFLIENKITIENDIIYQCSNKESKIKLNTNQCNS